MQIIYNETKTYNLPVQIYVKKIENRVVFKIKTGYELELLSPETMRLLGGTKKDADQEKDGEDAPKLEAVELVLVHFNLANNNCQQESKVLFMFMRNKQFGHHVH